MGALQVLSNLLVGETVSVSFDFSSGIPSGVTLQSVSITPEVVVGTDANYAATLVGSATISGSIVEQLIKGGVTGCTYRYEAFATLSDGEVLAIPVQIATLSY